MYIGTMYNVHCTLYICNTVKTFQKKLGCSYCTVKGQYNLHSTGWPVKHGRVFWYPVKRDLSSVRYCTVYVPQRRVRYTVPPAFLAPPYSRTPRTPRSLNTGCQVINGRFFWHLVINLSHERVYGSFHWTSHFKQCTRKIRQCLFGRVVQG